VGREGRVPLPLFSGGEGIRTPGILADSTDFKSAAFDRSATPPTALE
jgi:hypothetical protein